MIGHERAKATLLATIQRGTRSAILTISRRYLVDRIFDVPRLKSKFATDKIWAKTKSLRSNIASQIYIHKCGFNVPYHINRANGENVGNSLNDFIHDYGAPDHLTYNGTAMQVGQKTKFVDTLRRNHIILHTSAPRILNENQEERSIRDVKKRWYLIQSKTNIPDRLWDYSITWLCEIGNVTVSVSKYAHDRTPLEQIIGETPDITEYLDLTIYDWVLFKSNTGVESTELGLWLSVSHSIGPLLSYWILPDSGIPILCNMVQHLTNLGQLIKEIKEKMKTFTRSANRRLESTSGNLPTSPIETSSHTLIGLNHRDKDFISEYNRVIDSKYLSNIEANFNILNLGGGKDNCIRMEIGLPRGEDGALEHAIVKRRKTDHDGNSIGKSNPEIILDSRQYEFKFLNGNLEDFTGNVFAENLLAQLDEEGHRQLLIDEIIYHRTLKDAIPLSEQTFKTKHGAIRNKRTTKR